MKLAWPLVLTGIAGVIYAVYLSLLIVSRWIGNY